MVALTKAGAEESGVYDGISGETSQPFPQPLVGISGQLWLASPPVEKQNEFMNIYDFLVFLSFVVEKSQNRSYEI